MVQEPFMRALLSNLLDTDEQSERMLVDGAKELCNLLSGNLLTELFGNEKAFSLQAPIVTVSDVSTASKTSWPHLLCFEADQCPLALSFASGSNRE
jgi:CheY-specific phosphatase CheX